MNEEKYIPLYYRNNFDKKIRTTKNRESNPIKIKQSNIKKSYHNDILFHKIYDALY